MSSVVLKALCQHAHHTTTATITTLCSSRNHFFHPFSTLIQLAVQLLHQMRNKLEREKESVNLDECGGVTLSRCSQ